MESSIVVVCLLFPKTPRKHIILISLTYSDPTSLTTGNMFCQVHYGWKISRLVVKNIFHNFYINKLSYKLDFMTERFSLFLIKNTLIFRLAVKVAHRATKPSLPFAWQVMFVFSCVVTKMNWTRLYEGIQFFSNSGYWKYNICSNTL